MSRLIVFSSALLVILGIFAGCYSAPTQSESAVAASEETAEMDSEARSAYELATLVKLEKKAPIESDGLHNVFVLSENVISGSEPHGEKAFRALQDMGVKTILSVDGKLPDQELAKRFGMRYVHVPIQYKGIHDDALMKISKTYRELEGPFYVHCFHGRHRGPAAAAVGRIVLDKADRETAIAEMRQWFGTSHKYEGLYSQIMNGKMPAANATASFEYGFDAHAPVDGIAGSMVPISRAEDHLKTLKKSNFAIDPIHPDIDPVNEATILLQAYESMVDLAEVKSSPKDMMESVERSITATRSLRDNLKLAKLGNADAIEAAKRNMKTIRKECATCHKSYRNN